MTLKELRESKELTQADVARNAYVNLRTYQDYEQGTKVFQNAAGTAIHGLARALHVTMEEIMELESERTMYGVVHESVADCWITWYTSKERNKAVEDAKEIWDNVQSGDKSVAARSQVYVLKKRDRFVNEYGNWELSEEVDNLDGDVVWGSVEESKN